MPEPLPLVLIASRDEWTTRSVESVLTPSGFAVERAQSGARLLAHAAATRPDVVLLGTDLPDETGVSVARRLREASAVPPSTPILLLSPTPPSRAERIAALEAGAWDVLAFPVDPRELRARLSVYAGAKRDADAARGEGFVDAHTGLYNMRGLLRRSAEIAAFARRMEQPLACVVFEADRAGASGIELADGQAPDLSAVATVFLEVGRRSDVLGRVDEAHLAILATDTDDSGARGLARRLSGALEPGTAAALRTGVWAVSDAGQAPADPSEMITLATRAVEA
ncbi:MAG: response regulator [Gemmatimonadota bacterium]